MANMPIAQYMSWSFKISLDVFMHMVESAVLPTQAEEDMVISYWFNEQMFFYFER